MKKFLQTLLASLAILSFATACSSTPTISASNSTMYQSAYSVSDTSIGSYDLKTLTKAQQRKVVRVSFDNQTNDIFTQLLTQVDLYDEEIEEVNFDHSASEIPGKFGVGSVRICIFRDGKKLYEPIVVYEHNKFYAYTTDQERSSKSLPIKDVLLFYSFEEKTNGSSLVTVRAHYNVKYALLSPIINVAFGRVLNKTFSSAAKVFSGHLVNSTS